MQIAIFLEVDYITAIYKKTSEVEFALTTSHNMHNCTSLVANSFIKTDRRQNLASQ